MVACLEKLEVIVLLALLKRNIIFPPALSEIKMEEIRVVIN